MTAGFGEWLQSQRRRISSKSRLGERPACIHRQKDGLQTFLHDGRIGIGSNAPLGRLLRNCLPGCGARI
ncbi:MULTISPECIES: IS66 family transposase [unclassified Leisingera]|uniref:IS66 family transposase n=1 Tax=unclassified Leisingera TaxID=2614906 RepID=UPI001FFC8FD7|nr:MULTISPECIES: IS66 family transposase [unclassified Leisingera]